MANAAHYKVIPSNDMAQRALTHLIEFHPYAHRNECCAIGVLAIKADGSATAHPAQSLRKAVVLDPSSNVEALRAGMASMAAEISHTPSVLALHIKGFGALRLSPKAGYISYSDNKDYEQAIAWALAAAVEPRAKAAVKERTPTSRLFLDVKNTFSAYGWLAKTGQGINDHRIIARYPLLAEEGLSVDFALKNGVMHLLQTVDFRTPSLAAARHTEAQSKMMSFAIAPSLFDHPVQSLIIAGSGEAKAAQAMRLAERVANDIYISESSSDMNRLLNTLSGAMGQEPMPALTMH